MSEQSKKTERYYWLKMDRKFMDRHDIKILRRMGGPDKGARFVLFYITLLLESIDHNGYLRYDEDTPYNNDMLAAVTGEEPELAEDIMGLLIGTLNLVERQEDGTLHMLKLGDMVGSETAWAKKKREYRAAHPQNTEENEETPAIIVIEESGQSPEEVHTQSDKSKRQSKIKNKSKTFNKENITKENGPEKYSDEWAKAIKDKMASYKV